MRLISRPCFISFHTIILWFSLDFVSSNWSLVSLSSLASLSSLKDKSPTYEQVEKLENKSHLVHEEKDHMFKKVDKSMFSRRSADSRSTLDKLSVAIERLSVKISINHRHRIDWPPTDYRSIYWPKHRPKLFIENVIHRK